MFDAKYTHVRIIIIRNSATVFQSITPIRYISTIRYGIAAVDSNMENDKTNDDDDGGSEGGSGGGDRVLSIHQPIAFCPNRKERTFGYLFIKSTTSKSAQYLMIY